MAGVGAYVSLKPQPKERHTPLIALFVILFFLGGGINAIQTKRASKAQDKLQQQISAIQRQTETPPQVTVNIPPSVPPQIIVSPPSSTTSPRIGGGFLQVGNIVLRNQSIEAGAQISMNIFVTNKGTEPVLDYERYFGIAIASSKFTDRDVHKEFLRQALATHREFMKEKHFPRELGVGQQFWDTITTPPLTEEKARFLLNGTNRLYVYVWCRWKDERRDLDDCTWLQPPPTPHIDNGSLVWHQCAD